MGEHSKLLSPSSAGLWLTCTAMPQEKIRLGIEDKSGKAAGRGTLQHDYADRLDRGVIDQKDFQQFVGKEEGKLLIEEWTMVVTSVHATKKFLESICSTKFQDLHEKKVGFTGDRADCFGTLDRARVCIDKKVLAVVDHKFGMVEVDPNNNGQLRNYALALLETYPKIKGHIETVLLGISQPFIRDFVVYEEISLDDLLAWDEMVNKPAQYAVLGINGHVAEFVPGPHCKSKYCKVNKQCSALANMASDQMDEFVQEFNTDYPGHTVADMAPEKIGEFLDRFDTIATFAALLEDKAEELIRSGTDVPGRKIVNGRGKTVWAVDEEGITKVIRSLKLKPSELFKKTPPTPAQLKDAVKQVAPITDRQQEVIDKHTTYQKGSEKLVRADHKGDPIVFNTEDIDLTTEELIGEMSTELNDLDSIFVLNEEDIVDYPSVGDLEFDLSDLDN